MPGDGETAQGFGGGASFSGEAMTTSGADEWAPSLGAAWPALAFFAFVLLAPPRLTRGGGGSMRPEVRVDGASPVVLSAGPSADAAIAWAAEEPDVGLLRALD